MARKTTSEVRQTMNPPESLDDILFYGLCLDSEQKAFRDAIWNNKKQIIFCNARAGAGKTTISVGTALLLCRYGLFDDIVYVMHSVGDAQGYLPGTITEKSSVWFEGLYQALITCNEIPAKVMTNESMVNQKNGDAFVTALTDSYLRGSSIGSSRRTVMIVDEAQNFDEFSLRKTLTRACNTTKVIVIGHTGQIDLKNKNESSFERCCSHFMSKEDGRVALCQLTNNYRGFVSNVADEPWVE